MTITTDCPACTYGQAVRAEHTRLDGQTHGGWLDHLGQAPAHDCGDTSRPGLVPLSAGPAVLVDLDGRPLPERSTLPARRSCR